MDEDKTRSRWLGRLRALSACLATGAMVVLARPTPATVSLGFILVAAGEAIRFWAAGHLLKTVELVTSGPYRYTRNPLYLGSLFIFTGLCVMARLPFHANWIVLAVGYALFFGYYLRRRERVEPARMRRKHGETYESYFRAVPALFPGRPAYSEGASIGWSSDRMLGNREHWVAFGLVLASLYLLWRAYSLQI